jgi:hypothetical protein
MPANVTSLQGRGSVYQSILNRLDLNAIDTARHAMLEQSISPHVPRWRTCTLTHTRELTIWDQAVSARYVTRTVVIPSQFFVHED